MQTWIRANIGKLIDRITKAETAIGTPYENEYDLDDRTTALENAVGMPYTAPSNLSTRVYNLEIAEHPIENYTLGLQQVGKWVDGKTIYKKTTYTAEIPAGSSIMYTHGGGRTIEKLIKAEVIYSYRDSVYDLQFAGNVGNSRKLVQIYLDDNTGDIVVDFDNLYPYKDVYATYYYTLAEVSEE